MPELPEMETYKSLLHSLINGKPIIDVSIHREKSINLPVDEFIQQVANQKITSIKRRAKYLVFQLESGVCLLLHLMLGGWMFFGRDEDKPNRTVQVRLSFGEQHLHFIGLRLGYLYLLTTEMVREAFEKLGPEPLSPQFTIDCFLQQLHNRRGNLKSLLINQEVIAGIGNRYSDEILWHAELLPERKVHDLAEEQFTRLYNSILFILERGIQQGGYMENPLFIGDGKTGGYQMYVHDREGEACPRCHTPIVKKEMSSHKVYFCQSCQHQLKLETGFN